MNLTTDPWIPAVDHSGQRRLYSLNDLFDQAEEIRDLAVKPHERIALMRLLICIAQAALDGPDDDDAWEECRSEIRPAVKDYLSKWHTAFELFGDGARFLQVPGLKRLKADDRGVPASKLDLTLATGNAPTLFDQSGSELRELPSARSALNLLTFQCFSPGGLIGVLVWDSQETPGKGYSKHAPCTPSSMLHTLILGSCLSETLHANLLTRETVEDNYGSWGRPVWEKMPANADDTDSVNNANATFLGRLAPIARAVRLQDNPAFVLLGNAIDYPILPAFREPTATVVVRKEELKLLPASTGRAVWRQLASVTVKRRHATGQACGPLALSNVRSDSDLRLWSGAFLTDKAKIKDTVEADYTVPSNMLDPVGCAAYESGVDNAERMEAAITEAVREYATVLNLEDPRNEKSRKRLMLRCEKVRQKFWTGVEQHLAKLFELARERMSPDDIPSSPWGLAVKQSAIDAYEMACPRQNARQVQAFAIGLKKLHRAFKQNTQRKEKQQ